MKSTSDAGQRRRMSASTKRALGASLLALALLVAAYLVRAGELFSSGEPYQKLIAVGGALLFVAVGVVAVRNLADEVAQRSRRRMTPRHAGAIRLAVSLGGYLVLALVTLNQLGVQLGQLLLGGALTGVIIGIASQQSLGNLFAGLVLVFARPFTVGDRLRVHSGALGGPHEGEVIEMGLVYLTLQNANGVIRLPNSAVLGSAVAPNGADYPAAASSAGAADRVDRADAADSAGTTQPVRSAGAQGAAASPSGTDTPDGASSPSGNPAIIAAGLASPADAGSATGPDQSAGADRSKDDAAQSNSGG